MVRWWHARWRRKLVSCEAAVCLLCACTFFHFWKTAGRLGAKKFAIIDIKIRLKYTFIQEFIMTSPPSDPSRRERKRDARRQEVLEAAARLFKSKGYEATSVDDIAEEADIAKGTIYYHFETKEE